jgi:predicted nucleic acid binding AN1-type Zn finger protein
VITPGLPYQEGCEECTRLKCAEKTARLNHDRSREADYRVLARRHLRTVHGVVSVVQSS